MAYTVYHNYKLEETLDVFTSIMSKEENFFFGRIGGTDFDIANNYFNHKNRYSTPDKCNYALHILKHNTGYFDFEDSYSNFLRYLRKMVFYYQKMNYIFYACSDLIHKFSNEFILEIEVDKNPFLRDILEEKIAINYTLIENLSGFLKSFRIWGNNKKILIVSPFSESLKFQYTRLDRLLKKYTFPNFELVTYNTNITYNVTGDTKKSLGITTSNWHEECEYICKNISKLDFDIAFLSCGGYSMPVGTYINKTMQKKALYLGGILNVMFNIYGGRYNTPFFDNIINKEYQITALENDRISKLLGGKKYKSEAINAYFGVKQ